jgi:hypothetical protein
VDGVVGLDDFIERVARGYMVEVLVQDVESMC